MNCRDQCGKQVADDEAATSAGWEWLAIAGGWRCGECRRVLLGAGAMVGTDSQTVDALPTDSRGALPKETASTISPPALRG